MTEDRNSVDMYPMRDLLLEQESEDFRALPDLTQAILTYIIHSGFISGYQNRYGDNLKPPTNVYHRMTA